MDERDASHCFTDDLKTGRRSFLEQSLAVIATGAAATAAESSGATHAETSSPQQSPQSATEPPPVGATLRFFPGFEAFRIETGEAVINGVKGGHGPPLLLLQGWPQTHVEWHRVAPKLAQHFTVVATDLRGYGDSSKPPDGENHAGYSKRSTAKDQVELMRRLGFERFMVVGHDRGGRVAHRMALDHPEQVSKLALLDIAPTLRMYRDTKKEFASIYFHWFFLIQPAPLPETLFGGHGDFFLRNWAFRGMIPGVITEAAYAEYLRCFEDPATMHAMCEDYRAAATIDLVHDEADLDTRIRCPLLVLWGAQGAIGRWYDVIATWQERATDVRGKALPGGHWLPEQVPDELYSELMAFLH
jgi:haloacetate dehalogenase